MTSGSLFINGDRATSKYDTLVAVEVLRSNVSQKGVTGSDKSIMS